MIRKLLSLGILASGCFSDAPPEVQATEGDTSGGTGENRTTSSENGSQPSEQPESFTSSESSTSPISTESSESTSGVPLGDYALAFEGEQGAITPVLPGLPMQYTIEFEVRTEGELSGAMLSTVSNDSTVRGWLFYHDVGPWEKDDVLIFIDYNAPSWDYLADPQFNLNTQPGWHHVAVTKDNVGLLKLYLDGTQIAERQLETPFVVVENALRIGANVGGNAPLLGAMLDDIRISDVVRYDDTFEPESDLVADANTLYLWHFDEGDGGETVDEVGDIVIDLTNPMWMSRE